MDEAVSMERFGSVSVDYFHGRPVEDVVVHDKAGEGEPFWTIMLEGGAEIKNYDPSHAAPEGLVGKSFNFSILERGSTRLYFGTQDNPRAIQVNLRPTQYAIVDPHYTEGQTVFAQRSEANMPVEPPPHPDERVVEEPPEQPEADAETSDEPGLD